MQRIALVLASLLLVQCTHTVVEPGQPAPETAVGKVINERHYEINGIRKVERRILVSTRPYVTKLVTQTLW
jgi:hypothetical protein